MKGQNEEAGYTAVVVFRARKEIVDKLDVLARAANTTRSNVLRRLIEQTDSI